MPGDRNNSLAKLGAAADRMVAQNAHALARLAGAGLTPEQRAKRVWDIPAKMEVAQEISEQELERAGPFARNNLGDAYRHARWSARTAQATGPLFAKVAGIAHEAENLLDSVRAHGLGGPYDRQDRGPGAERLPPTPGQTIDEIRMDLHNNAEGRRAVREGREIDPRRLQKAPRTPGLAPLYRSPPSGVTFSGRR